MNRDALRTAFAWARLHYGTTFVSVQLDGNRVIVRRGIVGAVLYEGSAAGLDGARQMRLPGMDKGEINEQI